MLKWTLSAACYADPFLVVLKSKINLQTLW